MFISKKKYEALVEENTRYKEKVRVLIDAIENPKKEEPSHEPSAECEGCKHLIKEERGRGVLDCVYYCKLNNKCSDFEDSKARIVKINSENFNEAINVTE